jgi:cytochrome P450
MTMLNRPQAPRVRLNPLPFIGDMTELGRDPLRFLERLHAHGDVVRFDFMGKSTVSIANPDDVATVLLETGKRFIKGYQKGFALPLVLGNGLVTSEGDFWRRQRKLVQPAFHTQRIGAYATTMTDYTLELLQTWRTNETRDIHEDMMSLTQRIIAKTMFDADTKTESSSLGHALRSMVVNMNADFGLLGMFPNWVITPSRGRLKTAVAEIDAFLNRIIKARLKNAEPRGDLLEMLLEARDDDGHGMTPKQLRDELFTLYSAGHETTSNALAWTWLFLSEHSDAREQLERELDEVLQGRTATLEDIRRLTYTEAIIKESMRLHPPVWSISRNAAEDVELGGYLVPKNTDVWINAWILHRDARWFPEPLEFRPERWLEPHSVDKNLHKYAYIPFGGGPRICIGNSFAMLEAVLILATIAQQYRIHVTQPVEREASITLTPKHGVQARLQRRTP